MALPSRLARLNAFLKRSAFSTAFPLKPALKIKTLSLLGYGVWSLAKAQTGEYRDKDGRPNIGLLIREAIEEASDRLRGWNKSSIEYRKQERREARKKAEKERKEIIKRNGKKGIVLLRWPKKPKE